jgi:hypothetical protein
MLQAYVGIISQRGIEVLYSDDPNVLQFLWRRVRRQQNRLVCFWVVVPSEVGRAMLVAVSAQYRQFAWQLLQQHAFDYGSVVPDEDELSNACSSNCC